MYTLPSSEFNVFYTTSKRESNTFQLSLDADYRVISCCLSTFFYGGFFYHGGGYGDQVVAGNADGDGLGGVGRFGEVHAIYAGVDGFDISSSVFTGSFFEYGNAIQYKRHHYAR